MTLPLLLLGLYAGLLALSLALAGWVAHDHPTEATARRVTDAAERAALGQLASPAKQAGASILAISILACLYSNLSGGPTLWLALASVATPLLIGAALYQATRKLLRTTGQLVDLAGADARVSLTSRSVLSAVLSCESAVGLVLLGLHSLTAQELSASHSMNVVLAGVLSTSTAAIVFARASAAALLATGRVHGSSPAPHPASLAVLVAESFHGPLMRLLTLVVLSAFGHLALLLNIGSDQAANSLWLFPHLLKLLGLSALIFAGLVVRNQEDEVSAGWTRSAAVFLVLMIAGAWALSSELPKTWARSVPSGLTFFFLLVGATALVAPRRRSLQASPASGLLQGLAARTGSLSVFVVLLLTLVIATSLAPEDVALPGGALSRLVMAGALATAPLAVCWHLAVEVSDGSNRCAALAHAGQSTPLRPLVLPAPGLQALFPLLCFAVFVASLSGTLLTQIAISGSLMLLWCLGTLIGGAIIVALLGSLERSSLPTSQAIVSMIRAHQLTPDASAPLNFESAVECVRRDGSVGVPGWVSVLASSTACVFALRFFLPAAHFQSLGFGLALGAATAGTLIAWSVQDSDSQVKRTFARLALVCCLVQSSWLFATSLVQT